MKKDAVINENDIVSISKSFEGLYGDFVRWLPYLIVALVVFLIFLLAARTIRKVVRAAMARTSTEGHVDILMAQIAYMGTLSIGIIASLGLLGVKLEALFTGLGLAGFAIGFAMKDILGNFLSGIILLVQRPFTIGDRIVIGDIEGVVTNIRVRDTQITTYDGRLVFIPNNTLSTSNIINLTAFPKRRADINIGISYDCDVDKAIRTCLDTVGNMNGIFKEPAPEVVITGFADSAVMLQIGVWIDQENESFPQIKSDAYRALKEALDKAGIEIPFPTRMIHVRQNQNIEHELEEITGI